MNTLRQALDLRRGGETEASHPCHSAKAQVAALLVVTSAASQWVLPWMHFLNGHHAVGRDGETLKLVFARHEVVLHGDRLGPLAVEAANLRLERVRVVPADYREADATEPFIRQIEVRTADAANEHSGVSAPAQSSPASRNEK